MQSLAGNEQNRLTLAIHQEQHVRCESRVEAAKRSRIGRPKVRTGCTTCKTRRVKCDEGKPSCRRCIKFGVECQGYPLASKSDPPSRAIIPKQFLQPLPWTVRPLKSGPSFGSEQELRYFRIFCNETARQIAGPFKRSGSLWTMLMPQASEHEQFVHHAIVAIGALSKVSRDGRNFHAHQANGFRRDPDSEFAREYRYALSHYDKALKGMRKALESGIKDLRSALLACLLAFCIETLQGRQGPACALASKGLDLFNDKNIDYRRGISDLETRRNQLEEDLVHGFASLDIHVLFFLDNRPVAEHQRVIDDVNQTLKTMPSEIDNMIEAGHWWHKITRRDMHFKVKAQIIGEAAALAGAKAESGWTETADFSAGQVPFSKAKYSPKEIKVECQQYISDIYKYTQATAKFFSSIPESDQASIASAIILQVHAKMNVITLAGISFTSETSYDTLISEFRDITTLTASIYPQLIASSENSALYHFDLGVIPALYLVGSRCRDREVRGAAIDLLFSSPYREGIWDSFAVGHISNWLRSVEEAGGGGYIPEERRAFLTSADVDLYHRRAKLYCTQRGGPRQEDLVFSETLVQW